MFPPKPDMHCPKMPLSTEIFAMKDQKFVSPDAIRSAFSAAMSAMYREEVPAYGTLMDLVADVNAKVLADDSHLHERLAETDALDRISEERHGAIRLGTAAELSMMRRVFAVMGMFPVGYYDLSAAGVPVHSTAFPDTWAGIREEGLGYFAYSVKDAAKLASFRPGTDIEVLIEAGAVQFDPITYEDFLPVSAAGIFQSNLGDDETQEFVESPNQKRFEDDLGAKVLNEFEHYARIERESIEALQAGLKGLEAAE
ncbi:conserved hypothetical protein [Brucella melitensis bv. 2 str. 63/9]|nr:conserved hypothetical protein [Brucella melitensis bv. 2 str. 63/9]